MLISPFNWVTVEHFCNGTGYSIDAVYKKRSSGVWLEGEVWVKAPDNRILMSIRGYEQWVVSGMKVRPSLAA